MNYDGEETKGERKKKRTQHKRNKMNKEERKKESCVRVCVCGARITRNGCEVDFRYTCLCIFCKCVCVCALFTWAILYVYI